MFFGRLPVRGSGHQSFEHLDYVRVCYIVKLYQRLLRYYAVMLSEKVGLSFAKYIYIKTTLTISIAFHIDLRQPESRILENKATTKRYQTKATESTKIEPAVNLTALIIQSQIATELFQKSPTSSHTQEIQRRDK